MFAPSPPPPFPRRPSFLDLVIHVEIIYFYLNVLFFSEISLIEETFQI